TESVIPATSSMTIAPGSFLPRTRSARCAAHVPASVTTAKKTTRPVPEKGTSQRTSTVRALPTVPGATGTHPAPPAVAMISATRSAGVTRLGALADQLVPLDLDGNLVGEPGRRRSVLGRVREDAEPIEAHLVEEPEEILKRRLRFAREADQHRRADGEPRDRLAKRGDDLLHAPGGDGPAHGA